MIVLALEEFTARRRTAQETLEKSLHPYVEAAVDHTENTNGWQELLSQVRRLYAETYAEESGQPKRHPDTRWTDKLLVTLRKTKRHDESSVERITVWLATAILSKATVHAAHDDPEELLLEWVTMGDDSVRLSHTRVNGQQRPIGDKFKIGTAGLEYPGDPVGDPALWMNCRCTVRPVLASETLTAGGTMTYTPINIGGMVPTTTTVPIMTTTANTTVEYLKAGQYPPFAQQEPLPEEDVASPAVDPAADDPGRIPWHGVLAPEGVLSGDGRRFMEGSLTFRDLPLPLTWQKVSSDGHSGSVVVGKIEKIEMRDSLMRGSGYMLDTVEADELVGLIAEFGKFGVSVDADEAVMEVNEAEEAMDFSAARVCSAAVVAIPAFAEAYVALGPWDDEDVTAPTDAPVDLPADEEEALAASAEFAPGTEDGPGWLTHPVDTDRLRDYWVRGAGAAKIGWGAPGDFNRCRLNLAKYIKPQYLNGYCANRHKDALGVWPGQEAKAQDVLTATDVADAVHLVAAAGHVAPAEWFQDPSLQEPTHLTVTDEGQVYGHIARWDSCHIGFKGTCTAPPHSMTNYAYFLTGQVRLDNGSRVSTGPLTIGGGHANARLGLRAAVEHYDDVCAAVADVNVGEDEHGIWCAGWIRPGVTDEAITTLMASDISGDWREVGGNLEMCAALGVNTGGFPTPRTALAASAEGQTSLVASGIIPKPEEKTGGIDPEMLADLVALALERRETARTKMAVLREKLGSK